MRGGALRGAPAARARRVSSAAGLSADTDWDGRPSRGRPGQGGHRECPPRRPAEGTAAAQAARTVQAVRAARSSGPGLHARGADGGRTRHCHSDRHRHPDIPRRPPAGPEPHGADGHPPRPHVREGVLHGQRGVHGGPGGARRHHRNRDLRRRPAPGGVAHGVRGRARRRIGRPGGAERLRAVLLHEGPTGRGGGRHELRSGGPGRRGLLGSRRRGGRRPNVARPRGRGPPRPGLGEGLVGRATAGAFSGGRGSEARIPS